MLYKNKNSKWSLGKYAAVALLIGFASLIVASCERDSLPSARDTANKNVRGMINVFGVVRDTDGKPLPGASVEVKGATRGTSTDSDGKFRLDMPVGSDLIVKFVGFNEHLLKVNPKYKRVAFEVKMTPGDGAESTRVTGTPAADGKTLKVVTQASTYNGETVFTVVEEQPEFPGGIQAMYKFLAENLQYPAPAMRAKVQGKVFLNFVVTKEGEIKDATILKGIGFGADEEALRVMSQMPRWKPGMQDGKALNVRYNLPIAFDLGKKLGLKAGAESKKEGKS